MDIKLFDSELKVMDVFWKEGDSSASHIAEDKLFVALLGRKKLSTEQINKLKEVLYGLLV